MKLVLWGLFFAALAIFLGIFEPIIGEEIKYGTDRLGSVKYVIGTEQFQTFERPLTPPNTDFSIIIPKIAAVAPIIDNVDTTNPAKYLPALRKGIAHGAGSSYPDDVGNVFLFSHSADTFWNINTYNETFFLIGKLQNGDDIDIFYGGNLYKYEVYNKEIVEPASTQYIGVILPGEKTLTLQTDYPPGTTLKRLVVLAKEIAP